jgi:phosphatidylglycerol:prolipoprotein diacylglycerol transferase
VIESFRSDSLMVGPFKTAQLISLGFIVVGLSGYMGCLKKIFPRTKPVILFDLDGTLIHSRPLIDASFKHTFAHYCPEKELTQAELDSFFGPTLDETFSKYFEKEKVEEVIAYYREFNKKEHNTYVTLFPEVKETLETLKAQGYKMGIVSNKKRDVVDLGLEFCEIGSYFDVVLGGDELEEVKPSPLGLLQACALLKEGHDNVIYVGDNVNDILTVRNVGAYSVAYLNENQKRDEVIAIHPCKTIEHMSELLDIVSSRDEFFDLEEMV